MPFFVAASGGPDYLLSGSFPNIMRDQYAGDISDVLKIGFLRALANNGRRLGIAWYYASGDDGRPDGCHLEWQEEMAWRQLDPELFDGLSTLPERSIAALEKAPIWPPRTIFHREPMPPPSLRGKWSAQMRTTLQDANLIFLDPDNGLGSDPEKHATFDEIREFRKDWQSIVFITFPGRTPHDTQVQELHDRLKRETGTEFVFTLRTNVAVPRLSDPRYYVQRARWFTVIDADATLFARARGFTESLSTIPRVKAHLFGDGLPEQ